VKRTGTAIAGLAAAAIAAAATAGVARGEGRFPESPAELVGAPAPELIARDLAGDAPLTLESLAGGPVLLVFFATWCKTCRGLEGALASMHERLGPAGLRIVALSHEPRARIRVYRERRPAPYRVGQCTGRTALRYAATGLPTLVLLDRRGIVRGAWQGADPPIVRALERAAATLLRE
jgi:cytochrome c biogenesis protein CcmG, thiol:disulfide interchange protein DsbE